MCSAHSSNLLPLIRVLDHVLEKLVQKPERLSHILAYFNVVLPGDDIHCEDQGVDCLRLYSRNLNRFLIIMVKQLGTMQHDVIPIRHEVAYFL